MRIGIDCGHTLTGCDYGSKGILRDESYLTREVGVKVINKLKALGHTVVNCYKDTCSSLGNSLSYRVTQANNNNVDLFISIHFNAFNGNAHGTEVLTYGGKHFTEATNVLTNLVGLGYTNRGIKDGSNLYVLRNTKMKSMLIECCFCDNKNDMAKYDAEGIANAIVKGITGQNIQIQPKQNSFIKLDGGSKIIDDKPAINLIIRDFNDDIEWVFAWVDNDKNASWAFGKTQPNSNYKKLDKNCSYAINVRNNGSKFTPNAKYKIKVKGYNKAREVVAEKEIVLQAIDDIKDELYRVQVGAFRNKEYAERLKENLKKQGHNGFIQK